MRSSQIAQIILRLFALSWTVRGAVQTVGSIIASRETQGGYQPMMVVLGILTLVLAVGLWMGAPFLATRMVGSNDRENVVSSISYSQLLIAMFVGLGLYFCLSSFGATLNALHILAVTKVDPRSISWANNSFYQFIREALTFAAGVFLILSSRHWASKLAKGHL